MSNQAGQSNLRERLAKAGIEVRGRRPRASAGILAEVKAREDRGFAYDGASASFEILARRDARADAALLRGRALPRHRRAPPERTAGDLVTVSEAVVVARFGPERVMSVSESQDPVTHADQGPVNAL